MDTENETEAIRPNLVYLANALLQYYNVTHPPTPIERMVEEPPVGLSKLDLDKISDVMEHGLYNYAPRLAMAHLLCREIAHSKISKKRFDVDVSAATHADVKFFARCLMMPSRWVYRLARQRLSVEQISTQLQTPSYAVVTRLVELGLPLPDSDQNLQ
ncbi:MAG: hypothetical protein JXA14_02595 [Anaerolineae bacterium]|nr:hypothetical protein [Anaerolineae bacterium]